MTNVSAVMAELMEKVEVNSPRMASMHYCLSEASKRIAELEQKLAESEVRCEALAAENAGLKKYCEDAAFDADYESELLGERGGFVDGLSLIKTPATDAFLAEVQAQGVEMAVDVVKQCYDNICAGGLQENREYEESIVQPHLDGIDDELKEIIAQLRKGMQS